jgi:hypothetical protein
VPLQPSPDEDEDDLRLHFSCRPEVENYGGFDKFESRLNSLRNQICNDATRAHAVQVTPVFMIFVKNHPKATIAVKGNYPEWEEHEAQKLLRIDMEKKYHMTMTPSELWLSEEAYILFPLKVFWDHIYQEGCTRKYLMQIKELGKVGNKRKDYQNVKGRH